MIDAYLFICAHCVTDPFLSDRIAASGSPRKCMSCGQEDQNCWPVEALAEQVRGVFDEHCSLAANPFAMVESLTGLSDAICEEIVDCWSESVYLDDGDADAEDDDFRCSQSGHAADQIDRAAIDLRWQEIRHDLLLGAGCAAHAAG
ncbi:hypothetical protein [Bordetella sp. N]|uniref:hypothetical protein n=1 Tax=Bordetella sp. N TaxID=1746199 RepID=UPI00071002E7|nr:hypothetical protein [Bordetella sp. N]ALM83864.1 hypothetical protein ASB57_13575 [Bordetella sp. N]